MKYVTIGKDAMKEINKKSVFRYVWRHEQTTKSDIQQALGINAVTIMQLVEELAYEGKVISEKVGDSRGGRKPSVIEIDRTKHFMAAISVSKRSIEFGLVNFKGDILYKDTMKTDNSEDFFKNIHLIENKLHYMEKKVLERGKKIVGVGIIADGKINSVHHHIQDMRHFKIKNACLPNLGMDLNLPIYFAKKCYSFTLAEKYFGNSLDAESMVYINIDDYVNTGININGSEFSGYNLEAGNLEHLKVAGEAIKCECGKSGCLCSTVTNHGIVARFKELLQQGVKSKLLDDFYDEIDRYGLDFLTRELIYDYASAGDAAALKVIKETGQYIGKAVSQIINVMNPEKVFISGIYTANNIMNIEINKALNKHCYHTNLKQVYVGEPKIKRNRELLSAAALVLDGYLDYNL